MRYSQIRHFVVCGFSMLLISAIALLPQPCSVDASGAAAVLTVSGGTVVGQATRHLRPVRKVRARPLAKTGQRDIDRLVGQPADIASSAYQYRADRKAEENAPESWIGLMQYLGAPQDRPLDTSTKEARKVLCSLLWEEVRPIRSRHTELVCECQEQAGAGRGGDRLSRRDGRKRPFLVESDRSGVRLALPSSAASESQVGQPS